MIKILIFNIILEFFHFFPNAGKSTQNFPPKKIWQKFFRQIFFSILIKFPKKFCLFVRGKFDGKKLKQFLILLELKKIESFVSERRKIKGKIKLKERFSFDLLKD